MTTQPDRSLRCACGSRLIAPSYEFAKRWQVTCPSCGHRHGLDDARLIASAPELLAALWLCYEALDEVALDERDYPGWTALQREALAKAKDALALAEGRE